LDCSGPDAAHHAIGLLVCVISPPDGRIYITPALVALSAIIAVVGVLTTRSVARGRATIDLIEKRESTEHYRQTALGFSRVRRANAFGPLSNPKTDQDKADRQMVVDYLNHYELISIGILNNILDERIYRTWMRGPFTRDWNAAATWIQRERWKRAEDGRWTYYDSIFANYQRIALRWSPEAILLREAYAGPPSDSQAGGPGDEALPPEPGDESRAGE
jgi:hypothetical protein